MSSPGIQLVPVDLRVALGEAAHLRTYVALQKIGLRNLQEDIDRACQLQVPLYFSEPGPILARADSGEFVIKAGSRVTNSKSYLHNIGDLYGSVRLSIERRGEFFYGRAARYAERIKELGKRIEWPDAPAILEELKNAIGQIPGNEKLGQYAKELIGKSRALETEIEELETIIAGLRSQRNRVVAGRIGLFVGTAIMASALLVWIID